MACNFVKKETPTQVFSYMLKCLKKAFCGTPQASENGFEEFLRISKGGFTRNNLHDLTNLNE